jgi:hypothetical protein
MPGAAPGELVRLIRIKHASRRCEIEGAAGSTSVSSAETVE